MPEFKVYRKVLSVQVAWVEAPTGIKALAAVESEEGKELQWKDVDETVVGHMMIEANCGEIYEATALDEFIGITEEITPS